jgi:putative acetyltransferase
MGEHRPQSCLVAVEPPDQPDVDRLLQMSDAVAERLYPGEYRRPISGRSLDAPGSLLFMARLDGVAVGCAALLDLSDGAAELKRMIVDPEHAGKGVGRSLLRAILQEARERGISTILLEVGIHNVAARRLYEQVGFRDRGPFGHYRQTPIATFMEIDL